MKTIIAFTLLLISTVTFAKEDSELYLYTGAWSHHFADHPAEKGGWKYNESHDLVGLEYKGWLAAYYKNTFYDDGAIVAKELLQWSYGDFDFSAYGGAVYGYGNCSDPKSMPKEELKKKICPFGTVAVVYTRFKVEPALMLIPQAIIASIRWEL